MTHLIELLDKDGMEYDKKILTSMDDLGSNPFVSQNLVIVII